jgi:hypothetical protein
LDCNRPLKNYNDLKAGDACFCFDELSEVEICFVKLAALLYGTPIAIGMPTNFFKL